MNFFRIGLLAAGLAILGLPCRANIGDSLSQLRGRYGSAKDMGSQMLFEIRLRNGVIVPAAGSVEKESHFTVSVYFDGAVSGMEVFTRNTSDPAKANMNEEDISAILAATNDGFEWVPVTVANGKRTWVRSDKKLMARFNPSRSGDANDASVLVIMVNEGR